jgi:hypothetical protein
VKNGISISLHNIKKSLKHYPFKKKKNSVIKIPTFLNNLSKKKTTFQKERTEPTTILIS